MTSQSFRNLKKLHSAKFHQAQTQQQEVTNKEKSNVVVQGKTHIESTTQTQTTPSKMENLQQNSSYISPQSVYQKLSKTA